MKKPDYSLMIGLLIGAIIGHIIAILTFSSIFWFLWTYCSIGSQYFGFLPSIYHDLSFSGIVKIFFVLVVLRSLIIPIPTRSIYAD